MAKALNMDYLTQAAFVDEICEALPSRDYEDDDPNPLHQVFKARGLKEYYLQKVKMGEFQSSNTYKQGFSSSVNKNDKKTNAVELVMLNDGANSKKAPCKDDQLKALLQVLLSSLPKLQNMIKDFKKTKALIMTSKSPAGTAC